MEVVENEWSIPSRVNTDTGEIVPPVIVYPTSNEVLRVIDTSQPQQIRVKHSKFRDSREAKRAMHKLTTDERSMLATLFQYLEWETNMVVGDGDIGEKSKPLRFIDIDKISGMSKPTRVKVFKSLEDKKAIAYMTVRGKRSAIVVNPLYGYKGYAPCEKLKKKFEYEVDIDEDD